MTPSSPRVDIVLPMHGGERWLEEAVASVLAQSFGDWLLWLVDDASPDTCGAIAERLAEAHPERIRVIRLEEGLRAAGARMEAVSRGDAEWIAFLDQDDRWLPQKLERQLARAEAEPEIAALHCDVTIIDSDGRPMAGAAQRENAQRAQVPWGSGPSLAKVLFRKNSIRLASSLVRRQAFRQSGGFDTSLFGGEDWEFWVRFASQHSVAHVAEILVERRVHDANVSRVHASERTLGKLRALEKRVADQPDLGPLAAARRAQIRAAGGLADPPLAVCTQLFARLAGEGFRYCHWKSNEHVEAALAGHTDFDLLVDPADRERFEAVLTEFDFKACLAPAEKRFPGMRDRLGFDRDQGALVHLHVHEQLVLGTSGVKNHRIPIEALVLDGGRTLHGVRTPSAELELLLLAVRAPLKVSRLRLLRRWRKDATKTLQSALVREMAFLLPDVGAERFSEAVAKTGLALDPQAVLRFVEKARDRTLTPAELRGFRARVLRALHPHRRKPAWRAAVSALRARALASPRARRFTGSRGRRLPERGRLLALVGADGSGKSTLAADLREWLGWKLRVEDAYFGIPKPTRGYRALRRAHRLLGWTWLDAERWVYTARYRLRTWRRARRAVAAGAVVIADRYPLPDLWRPPQPMDGPRLANHPLGVRERSLYAKIGLPDRAFVLRTPLAVLKQRDPGVDPAIHERKAQAVNALEDSPLYSVVDADRPYEAVLLDLKRRIWDEL